MLLLILSKICVPRKPLQPTTGDMIMVIGIAVGSIAIVGALVVIIVSSMCHVRGCLKIRCSHHFTAGPEITWPYFPAIVFQRKCGGEICETGDGAF